MKISELKKGDTGIMKGFGKVQIAGVAQKYIRVKQLEFGCIIAKISFRSNADDISAIGFNHP